MNKKKTSGKKIVKKKASKKVVAKGPKKTSKKVKKAGVKKVQKKEQAKVLNRKKKATSKKATKKASAKKVSSKEKDSMQKKPSKSASQNKLRKKPLSPKKEDSVGLKQESSVSQVEKIETEKAAKALDMAAETIKVSSISNNEDIVILTDADGRMYCRVKDCDQVAVVEGYCRYHYLLYWKSIQTRKKILAEGKLEKYIYDLTARYPDRFLELLYKDLRSEHEFISAIQELEIDENSNDDFEDDAKSFLDEVRGVSPDGGASSRTDDDDY